MAASYVLTQVSPELTLFGQLAGPVIGAAIAYFVMRLNQQQQAALDDVKDARALRDMKRARLASVYQTALAALVAMDHFVSVQHRGEVEEGRLDGVFVNIDQALAQLKLEPDAQHIAQQFENIVRAFTGARLIQGQNMDPQIRQLDVQRRRDEFQQKAATFQLGVHASLEPLDQPVSTAHRRRPWWRVWDDP